MQTSEKGKRGGGGRVPGRLEGKRRGVDPLIQLVSCTPLKENEKGEGCPIFRGKKKRNGSSILFVQVGKKKRREKKKKTFSRWGFRKGEGKEKAVPSLGPLAREEKWAWRGKKRRKGKERPATPTSKEEKEEQKGTCVSFHLRAGLPARGEGGE